MSDDNSLENNKTGEFIRSVHKFVEGGKRLSDEELDSMIDQLGLEKVGMGAECVVVSSPKLDRERKVLAVSYKGEKEPYETFYLQRIYSTLFPKNFPKFYMAGKSGFTQRERVTGSGLDGKNYLVGDGKDWEGIATNFSGVYEFQKLVDPPVFIDDTSGNFMISTEGDVVFVDTLEHKGVSLQKPVWDITKVRKYMEEHNYKDTEMRRVMNSINRLIVLGFAESKTPETKLVRTN